MILYTNLKLRKRLKLFDLSYTIIIITTILISSHEKEWYDAVAVKRTVEKGAAHCADAEKKLCKAVPGGEKPIRCEK